MFPHTDNGNWRAYIVKAPDQNNLLAAAVQAEADGYVVQQFLALTTATAPGAYVLLAKLAG